MAKHSKTKVRSDQDTAVDNLYVIVGKELDQEVARINESLDEDATLMKTAESKRKNSTAVLA